MEEYLMEAEATQEQLAMITGTAGMDMDRTATVRALGAYTARKHLRPDFQEMRFKSFPPAGASAQAEGNITSDQGRMREIVALLSAQKLEVEHMRQSIIPPLTATAIDRFLTEALPYAWMTSLGAALKEIALEDPSGAWTKQPLPVTVWRVLNEELRAKRQGRPSAPAVPANPAAPAPCITTPHAAPTTGSGTVCFNCGQRGHIARVCPWKQAGGQMQQVGQHTLWVNNNRACDMNGPPPAPCNRCGQWHWAQYPCPQPAQAPPAATAAQQPPAAPGQPQVDWGAALLQLLQQQDGPTSSA